MNIPLYKYKIRNMYKSDKKLKINCNIIFLKNDLCGGNNNLKKF